MNLFSTDGQLDFNQLESITQKPQLFAKDDGNFWQDPYISEHLLYAHLDDENDQGSRKYENIVQAVRWISSYLKLPENSKFLDLGCGPGLYSENFFGQGFDVTGIDFSENSIRYAKDQAANMGYPIQYHCKNYLDIDYENEFEVVSLIYGDLCVLSIEDRNLLLKKVYKALKPGGYLVFDVFTKCYFKTSEPDQSWYISMEDGFWSDKAHCLLQSHYKYKKEKVRLDKYTLIFKDGCMRTHHIWKHYFSLKRTIEMMNEHTFKVLDYWSNLRGKPYEKGSPWIAMIAQKQS